MVAGDMETTDIAKIIEAGDGDELWWVRNLCWGFVFRHWEWRVVNLHVRAGPTLPEKLMKVGKVEKRLRNV